MPVQLTAMRDALLPGLHFMFHANEPLALSDIPEKYEHLRRIFNCIPIRKVGDLQLPQIIRWEVGALVYETRTVFLGREYPQGWGRGPGGAVAEPPPEPDGKVDVFGMEDNNNMRALKADIQDLIDGWERH